MALGKQAKTLNKVQVEAVSQHVASLRNGLRNQVVLLLSVRAGLRAKEIASLRWCMIVGADGEVGDSINLTDEASKGRGGRVIALNRTLGANVSAGNRESVSAVVRRSGTGRLQQSQRAADFHHERSAEDINGRWFAS